MRYGSGAPALVIAHGLFGSQRNWAGIAKSLAREREVVVPDLRNHGDSPHVDAHGYADLAGDLGALIADEGGAADVLGHSMGGKAAMVLALTEPARVRRLVVADIAPVAYDHDQQVYLDAMAELDLAGLASRTEADARLAPAVADPRVRAFLLTSLDLRARPPRWRINLAALDRAMPGILDFPGTVATFDGPALFISGARSDYVRPEHRPAILARFPDATFAVLESTGHWLHAEAPEAFVTEVRRFLG